MIEHDKTPSYALTKNVSPSGQPYLIFSHQTSIFAHLAPGSQSQQQPCRIRSWPFPDVLVIWVVVELMIGLEPITCWLQIRRSTNWATPAIIIGKQWIRTTCASKTLNQVRHHYCLLIHLPAPNPTFLSSRTIPKFQLSMFTILVTSPRTPHNAVVSPHL